MRSHNYFWPNFQAVKATSNHSDKLFLSFNNITNLWRTQKVSGKICFSSKWRRGEKEGGGEVVGGWRELITEQSEDRCIYMYFSVISVTNVRKNNHRFEGIFKKYKKEERCSNKIISNQSRKLDSLRHKLSSPFQLELDAILLPDIYIKDILDNNSPKNFLQQIIFWYS